MSNFHIKVSKAELYQMLKQRGYSIKIQQVSEDGRLVNIVLFSYDMWETPTIEHTVRYTPAWTEHAIINDCVEKLLKLSGRKLCATLW